MQQTAASNAKPGLVGIIGATGYIGGRLAPLLLEQGYTVRAVARSGRKIRCRSFASHPNMQIAIADAADFHALKKALSGCDTVYYLVHSMQAAGRKFAERDKYLAGNTANAASAARVGRIIYLGGLGADVEELSHHLRSRLETGDILSAGRVPVTQLHAAMILGAGSASFEIMRYLVERLPLMLAPRWVNTRCQPIAVSNVLGYLLGCLEQTSTTGQSYDIGGPDILTYGQLFQLYAEEKKLPRRWIVPLPVLTPRLSSQWIHLITPVPASLARPLAEGLRNEVVCKDNRIQKIIPQELLSIRQAIRTSLRETMRQNLTACWADAGELRPPEWLACGDAEYAGGTILSCNYKAVLSGLPGPIWETLLRIGGKNGWFYAMPLWRIRGVMDRLAGGAGLQRGRRAADELRIGDALDFWRVLELEPEHKLVLLAEMKMPGEAVFQFQINPLGPEASELQLNARFLPSGLAGLAYWYGLLPIHGPLYQGMIRRIASRSGCSVLRGPESYEPGGHVCALPEGQ